MKKKVKLAILRARHDGTTPLIPDQACEQMIFANSNQRALLQYWSFNTYDYLDLSGSNMFEWVDVTMGQLDGQTRDKSAKAAYDATTAKGYDLSSFDGFLVLMLPGDGTEPNPDAGKPGQPATISYNFDGGTGNVPDGRPVSVYPVIASDLTFMCHEMGHVLGFHHTFGLSNNGTDWDQSDNNYIEGPEYGDPYDIMSSAAFGSRWENPDESHYFGSPTFTGPVVPDWPTAGAFGMGPAPARAHLHLWDPSSIPKDVLVSLELPQGNDTKTARIYRTSPGGLLPSLVVVSSPKEGPDGQGRIYVEYRDSGGWDAGLKTNGTDLSRQAVVVHALADTTSDGTRCWYRGRILVPLETDGDLAVPDVPLVIKVIDVADDLDFVDLEFSQSSSRAVQINQSITDIQVGIVRETVARTACGDIHTGTYQLQRVSRMALR